MNTTFQGPSGCQPFLGTGHGYTRGTDRVLHTANFSLRDVSGSGFITENLFAFLCSGAFPPTGRLADRRGWRGLSFLCDTMRLTSITETHAFMAQSPDVLAGVSRSRLLWELRGPGMQVLLSWLCLLPGTACPRSLVAGSHVHIHQRDGRKHGGRGACPPFKVITWR